MTTRRGILKLVGGGVVVAAAAGGGWYAMNGPSNEAREAWRQAGTPQEYRRRFLSYALLAPNPHNRQPWLVRLDGEDGLTLFCDLDRRLPETDPFDRQITLGCGAFLELLTIAAAQEGYRADITPFPDGVSLPRLDERPVRSVAFLGGASKPQPCSVLVTFHAARSCPPSHSLAMAENSARLAHHLDAFLRSPPNMHTSWS